MPKCLIWKIATTSNKTTARGHRMQGKDLAQTLPREALPVLSSQTPPHLASTEVMGCVRGWRRHQVPYGLNGQDAHKHNFYRVKTWAGDIVMTEVRAHMAVSMVTAMGCWRFAQSHFDLTMVEMVEQGCRRKAVGYCSG